MTIIYKQVVLVRPDKNTYSNWAYKRFFCNDIKPEVDKLQTWLPYWGEMTTNFLIC